MYQIQLDDGVQAPINTNPVLSAEEALYWADRIRYGNLMPDCGVNIIQAAADCDWLTKNLLPANTRQRTEV